MDAMAIDVPADRAVAFAARRFGVSRALLANPRRHMGLVRARALVAWSLHSRGVSYPRIAAGLGTERNGAMNFERIGRDLRTIDPDFVALCDQCIMAITGRTDPIG